MDGFDQGDDVWTPNDLFFERPQALPGESIESGGRSMFFNYNLNGIHTYSATKFSATTALGLQYEDRRLNTFQIRTQNLLPGQRNVNQGTNITATENLNHERTVAFYGQEDVRLFSEALLLRGGLRAEQSSVNGDIDKYYIFPQVSASYRFRNMIGSGSELKMRAAYGETGNQPLFGQKFTNLATPQLGGSNGLTVSTASRVPRCRARAAQGDRGRHRRYGAERASVVRGHGLLRATRRTCCCSVCRRRRRASRARSSTAARSRTAAWKRRSGYSILQGQSTTWLARATFTKYTSEVKDLAGLPPFFPASSGFGNLGRTRIEVGKPITQIVGFDFDSLGNRAATLTQLGNSAPDFRMGFDQRLHVRPVRRQRGGRLAGRRQHHQPDAVSAG